MQLQSAFELTAQLKAAGIEVVSVQPFEENKFEASALGEIKRSGMQIILLCANRGDTMRVAMAARGEGMTGPGRAWVIFEERKDLDMLSGWIYFLPLLRFEGMQAFAEQVMNYTQSHFGIVLNSSADVDLTYSTALFDTVMLYAHAATKVLSEGGELTNGKAVTDAVRSTRFEGIGGPVALDEQGDRVGSYELMNYVGGEDGGMESVPVGMYDIEAGEYKAYEGKKVVWPGGTTEVPVDYVSGAPHHFLCGLQHMRIGTFSKQILAQLYMTLPLWFIACLLQRRRSALLCWSLLADLGIRALPSLVPPSLLSKRSMLTRHCFLGMCCSRARPVGAKSGSATL